MRGYGAMLLLYVAAMVLLAIVASVAQPASIGAAPVIVIGGLAVGAPALGLAVPIALLVERAARRLRWRGRLGAQALTGAVLGAATGWLVSGGSPAGWWIALIGAAAGAALASVGRGVAERSIRARALEAL